MLPTKGLKYPERYTLDDSHDSLPISQFCNELEYKGFSSIFTLSLNDTIEHLNELFDEDAMTHITAHLKSIQNDASQIVFKNSLFHYVITALDTITSLSEEDSAEFLTVDSINQSVLSTLSRDIQERVTRTSNFIQKLKIITPFESTSFTPAKYDTSRASFTSIIDQRIDSLKSNHFLHDLSSTNIFSLTGTRDEECFVYHATRLKSLAFFTPNGIFPQPYKNEFSPSNSFYTTNNIFASIKHALQTKVRFEPDNDIVILCFKVKPSIILGNTEISHEELTNQSRLSNSTRSSPEASTVDPFKSHIFQDANVDWYECCNRNMFTRRPFRIFYPQNYDEKDFVIGPLCTPDGTDSRTSQKTVTPVFDTLIDAVNSPSYQIAANTPRAWDYMMDCLVCVYQEKRVGEVSVEESEL